MLACRTDASIWRDNGVTLLTAGLDLEQARAGTTWEEPVSCARVVGEEVGAGGVAQTRPAVRWRGGAAR